MASACVRFGSEVWYVEEIKDLVREAIVALGNRQQDHDLLIRMDETSRSTAAHISALRIDLEKMDKKYVTRQEFEPIKRGYYGLAGLIGTAIAGAILKLVILK